MVKSHKEYWKKRNEELEKKWAKKSQEEIEKELAAYYKQSLTHIQKDIAALYARFATENGLSVTEAKKLLTGDEFKTWRMDIKDYVKQFETTGNPDILKELNTLSMRSRVTRLDKLYGETLTEFAALCQKSGKSIGKFLPEAYRDFYYHNIYEIGKTVGLQSAIVKVDPKRLEEVLRVPWSGKHYSKRIWDNGAKLAKTINQTIIQATHRGTSIDDLSRMVSQKMNVGISDATRLVRTELNYVLNRASLDGIKEAGMDFFQFCATLDNRTSPMCREHDGHVYPIEDARPGENMPPLHPRCRSTVFASLDDGKSGVAKKGSRIARDESGKNIRIPADMAYNDWKAVYIDKKITKEAWEAQSIYNFKTDALSKAIAGATVGVTEAQKILAATPNKTYSNIWAQDVTLDDYAVKQGAIPAKMAYFDQQIAAGTDVAKFQKLKANLLEFEKLGADYEAKSQAVKDAKNALNDLEEKLYEHLNGGKPNAYSDKRKKAAYWFSDKAEADKVLRPDTGKFWRLATNEQKQALYDYTKASGKFNRPLAGFEKPWSMSGSGWEPKFKKGVGKVWIDFEGAGKSIRDITDVLPKCQYNFDIWLQRGCDQGAMDSFFGLKPGTFANMSPADLKNLIGHKNTMDNFISTAACQGGGFNTQPVILKIYAPKGTNMIYAEPFSYYGGASTKSVTPYWDGLSGQSSFGYEFEVIVQRGTNYKVTDIEYKGGKYYIEMEIHPEKGYNLFQQDPNEWKGSRTNYQGQTVSLADELKGK